MDKLQDNFKTNRTTVPEWTGDIVKEAKAEEEDSNSALATRTASYKEIALQFKEEFPEEYWADEKKGCDKLAEGCYEWIKGKVKKLVDGDEHIDYSEPAMIVKDILDLTGMEGSHQEKILALFKADEERIESKTQEENREKGIGKTLSELIKAIEDKFGVKAEAQVVAGPSQAVQEEVVVAQTEFDVLYKSFDENKKIPAIKFLRESTGKSLTECKAFLETMLGKPLKEKVSREDAEKTVNEYTANGVYCEIK